MMSVVIHIHISIGQYDFEIINYDPIVPESFFH